MKTETDTLLEKIGIDSYKNILSFLPLRDVVHTQRILAKKYKKTVDQILDAEIIQEFESRPWGYHFLAAINDVLNELTVPPTLYKAALLLEKKYITESSPELVVKTPVLVPESQPKTISLTKSLTKSFTNLLEKITPKGNENEENLNVYQFEQFFTNDSAIENFKNFHNDTIYQNYNIQTIMCWLTLCLNNANKDSGKEKFIQLFKHTVSLLSAQPKKVLQSFISSLITPPYYYILSKFFDFGLFNERAFSPYSVNNYFLNYLIYNFDVQKPDVTRAITLYILHNPTCLANKDNDIGEAIHNTEKYEILQYFAPLKSLGTTFNIFTTKLDPSVYYNDDKNKLLQRFIDRLSTYFPKTPVILNRKTLLQHAIVHFHKPFVPTNVQQITYILNYLLKSEYFDISLVFEKDLDQNTILHTLAQSNSGNIFIDILNDTFKTANINSEFMDALNADGMTALHIAASRHNLQMVDFLIHNGANVNALTASGKTVLDLALGEDELKSISEAQAIIYNKLLQAGADANIKQEGQQSAKEKLENAPVFQNTLQIAQTLNFVAQQPAPQQPVVLEQEHPKEQHVAQNAETPETKVDEEDEQFFYQ